MKKLTDCRLLLKAKACKDAVKEHIASELRVAREIQIGMLPQDIRRLANLDPALNPNTNSTNQ